MADNEINGCCLQWKIKNISHCWLKQKQKITSLSFTADMLEGTKWSLWLYPMGNSESDNEHVGVFLNRKEDCSGPNAIIEVQFQLSFLDRNGSSLKEGKISGHSFTKGGSWGYAKFEARKLIFITNREAFLPDDTLTVQCMIWKGERKPVKPRRFFGETVIGVNLRSFVWTINDFSTLKSGLRNEFNEDIIQFDLVLSEELDFEKKLLLNILSCDEDMKYFSFKISIVDSEGKKEDCGTQEYFLGDLKDGISTTVLFTKKLMENKSLYLPNDVLSLECEYIYSDGSILYEYVVSGIIYPTLKNEIVESLTKCGSERKGALNATVLVNDLKSLYNDAICSDIVLRTSTKTYPAHKGILSARSPVFKSMFSNDMKERNSGQADITDFEDDTIHRMLLYVYTDSLEALEFESASKLYAAADKYQILSLRDRCSSFLKENLCPEKACDVLILADLHHDDDLKNAVVDYILGQRKQVFCSQEWKDFMKSHVELAADVMYKKIYQD